MGPFGCGGCVGNGFGGRGRWGGGWGGGGGARGGGGEGEKGGGGGRTGGGGGGGGGTLIYVAAPKCPTHRKQTTFISFWVLVPLIGRIPTQRQLFSGRRGPEMARNAELKFHGLGFGHRFLLFTFTVFTSLALFLAGIWKDTKEGEFHGLPDHNVNHHAEHNSDRKP